MVGKSKKSATQPFVPVRAADGSSFSKCPKCEKLVAVALLSSHGCGIASESPVKEKDSDEDVIEDKPKQKKTSSDDEEESDKKEKKPTKKKAPAKKKEKNDDGEKKTRKRKKKEPDENKVKKPSSSFLFYVNKNREIIKQKNPDVKLTEISKIAGAQWKLLSPEEKKLYEDMAEQDKKRYHADLVAKGLPIPEKKVKKVKTDGPAKTKKAAKPKAKKEEKEEEEGEDQEDDDAKNDEEDEE